MIVWRERRKVASSPTGWPARSACARKATAAATSASAHPQAVIGMATPDDKPAGEPLSTQAAQAQEATAKIEKNSRSEKFHVEK
jgi:hypothetical protein